MLDDARDPNSDDPHADPVKGGLPVTTVEDTPANATPAAFEVADHSGVDIGAVAGTGKGGKVTKADVEAADPGTD
jgi:2-oxoglutarate dehydrogenase E2 component (dihydrolipoamide succinyltransferase)